MDREKIVALLTKAIEERKPIPADDAEKILAYLTVPAGTYYDYGEYDCKECGCPVSFDDIYCPRCGRVVWEEED